MEAVGGGRSPELLGSAIQIKGFAGATIGSGRLGHDRLLPRQCSRGTDGAASSHILSLVIDTDHTLENCF